MLDDDDELVAEYSAYYGACLEKARDSRLTIGSDSQINHLAAGEQLEFHTAATPSGTYLPFSTSLKREFARCIGVAYSALAMDHGSMTYSSARMETASIWPVVLRRRQRIATPIYQATYDSWLDESVGEGRIPFKGGYEAFRALRALASQASWQGPAKPTADDQKAAGAASERLWNGTSSLADECADLGRDINDVLAARKREMAMLREAGLPSPFERAHGGAPAGKPDGTRSADAPADRQEAADG